MVDYQCNPKNRAKSQLAVKGLAPLNNPQNRISKTIQIQ